MSTDFPSDPINNQSEVKDIASLYPEEIRVLSASLAMNSSGGLNVAECDHPLLQDALFAYFRGRLAVDRIYLYPIEVDKNSLNLTRNLIEITHTESFKDLSTKYKYRSIVFFVHGLELLTQKDRHQFFQLFDAQWTHLAKFPHQIVIWGTAQVTNQMSQSLPEFWGRKAGLFQFPTETFKATDLQQPKFNDNLTSIHTYIDNALLDQELTIWQDLYLPLRATYISEAVNVITDRHTLNNKELAQLSEVFAEDIAEIAADQIILQKDASDTGCYVLLQGEVEISIPDSLGQEMVISRMTRGDFFGEIALIKSIPRTATARSVTACKYILLTKPKLRAAASEITDLLKLMNAIAEQRLDNLLRTPTDVMSPIRRFASQGGVMHAVPVPVNVFDLINQSQKTILRGDAGMGKTTVSRAFMLHLVENAQNSLLEQRPISFPIFVSLRELRRHKQMDELVIEALHRYQVTHIQSRADLTHWLTDGEDGISPIRELVFIFDGLNELEDRADGLEQMTDFIESFANHRFVITCRSQDYVPLRDFKPIMLQQLTEREIEPFLANYLGKDRGKKVSQDIFADQQLIDLARSPLALYMFAQITDKVNDSLPKNRGVLFDLFVNNLLERNDIIEQTAPTGDSLITLTIKKSCLASLALMLQQNHISSCPQETWISIVASHTVSNAPDIDLPISNETMLQSLNTSGLIRSVNHGESVHIEFTHQTYQEFFTALALRDQALPIESYLTSDKTLRRWYGVIILLYGISADRTTLFSQILGSDEAYIRIWLAAQCLASSGDEIAVATETLEKHLPPTQKFAMLFSVGLASYLIHRYPEGLTYLLRAAEAQPANAEVQYELGSLYRQVGQYERAITHLESAIHLRPDFVDAYNQLGITYYNQKKHEEAMTIFMTTTQLEPANAHHYYNLGSVQKVLKDYQTARDSFQMAVRLDEDYTEARIQLDLLEKAFTAGVVKVLKSIPMLSKLSLEQTIMLANRLNVVEYKAGEIVFHMGETGDTFYIIEFGSVEVLAPDMRDTDDKNSPVINNLVEGDFFGEIALLQAVPRTATIRCTANTRLLELSRTDFTDIVNHYPSIAYSMAETSRYRLSDDRKAGRHFNRYYNPSFIQELLDRQDEATVLMGDIHGSTFLTNSIGPELMVAFLDEYLLRMSTIIVNAGGAVDKSLGDSVMGVFGHFPDRADETPTSPAIRSLMAGLQMRQAYLDLREEWRIRSPIFMQTGMGIGINTGSVKIGTVGAEASMVGSAVNVSSKLSKMAVKGRNESEIYIDERTYRMLQDSIEVEVLDPSYVVGKSGGVELTVYRVVRNVE